MSNYEEYDKAKKAIRELITSKEDEIKDVESQIDKLKRVKRMMDEEFMNKLGKTEEYIG